MIWIYKTDKYARSLPRWLKRRLKYKYPSHQTRFWENNCCDMKANSRLNIISYSQLSWFTFKKRLIVKCQTWTWGYAAHYRNSMETPPRAHLFFSIQTNMLLFFLKNMFPSSSDMSSLLLRVLLSAAAGRPDEDGWWKMKSFGTL